jgi:hypothetical protein
MGFFLSSDVWMAVEIQIDFSSLNSSIGVCRCLSDMISILDELSHDEGMRLGIDPSHDVSIITTSPH